MNYSLILSLISNMLKVEAILMIFPLIISFTYGGGDIFAFLWSMVISAATGLSLSFIKPKDIKFKTKDAFAAAALSWLLLSLFGALPFYFSGYFNSFVDCVFESISGFTTTGATVLSGVEHLPKGIVFWRSFSQWVGGMGVVVFMMAVIPSMNASSINLLRAESTGPSPDRVLPKIRGTARVLYLIYFAMTVILFILLMIAGFPLYDSLINAMSTAGTGGFSNMNASIGAYNNIPGEIIITIFMILFSVSFTLYFSLHTRIFKQFFKDEELLFFFGIVFAAIVIITIDINGLYGSLSQALRKSAFQVSSVISTTGSFTVDYNLWPTTSRVVLALLMFTGGCAGSTSGGVKLIRILILLKTVKIEMNEIIHPRSVKAIMLNGKRIDNDVVSRIGVFFFVYFLIFIISALLISFEGKDLITCITAVISMLSNIGPGLGLVGPMGNFSIFSTFSKIILSFCMLAGRLEFFPILILFMPSIWKRH